MSPPQPHEFLTLAGDARYEIDKVKGSRFFASGRSVQEVPAAEAFVAELRSEFPDATHHCYAYRIGVTGEEFRSSDDGEPSGSAGRPILAQIEGRGVTNVAVVVTRYYGGTKLGVGGLMRAYGAAAAGLLQGAPVRMVVITRRALMEFPYSCAGAVDGVLHARSLTPSEPAYGELVRYSLEIPEAQYEEVLGELTERTAGRLRVL